MNNYQIKCKNIKDGNHLYEFTITNSFFDEFIDSEITRGDINISVIMKKNNYKREIEISINGIVNNLVCDLCAEEIPIKIISNTKFLIRNSETKKESLDEIIYVEKNQDKIYIKNLLFEMIVLALPNKRKHNIVNGKRNCNKQMLELIDKYSSNTSFNDSRWDELKKIKAEIK